MQNKASLILKRLTNYRRFSTTLVLLQVGLDVETSAVCIAVLWFGQSMSTWLFIVSFNFIFTMGRGSGLDVMKYPTCSNTCPLAEMQ